MTHGRFLEESTVINHHISTLTISEDFRRQELLVRHLVPSHGPVCDHQRILTLFPLLVSVMQHTGLLESLHGSPQNRSQNMQARVISPLTKVCSRPLAAASKNRFWDW